MKYLCYLCTKFQIRLCKGIKNWASNKKYRAHLTLFNNIMVTSIEPKLNPAGKYTISETCGFLGIHRNTLRAYVKAGMIRPVPKKQNVLQQRFRGLEILRFWNAFV